MYDSNVLERLSTPRLDTDLRRAGYHDGEPAPRIRNHWANQPSSVKARYRGWRRRRANR